MPQFHMYILRCADGSYYVGSTSDVDARVELHNDGGGPSFTARRLPVTLVYTEPFNTMTEAREREVQIKKWSRAKKEALVVDDLMKLHRLSRCRSKIN